MAESSLTRRVVARTTIEADVNSPNASAPRNTLRPRRKAMTTPGKMAWERASPMNESPRSTTYVPIAPVTAPMRITSIRARCMNA